MSLPDPLLIENLTVNELRDALGRTQTVILPLGCTEQHGYHLPLSTDTLIGYAVAVEAARRSGCLVAPPVPYTFSGGELTGTLNVSPQVTALYVREICRALAAMGAKRIVVFWAHGGSENTAAIREGLKVFLWQEKAHAELTVLMVGVWEVSKLWMAHFEAHDYHAALVETSLVLHLRPELVRENWVTDRGDVAKMLRGDPDRYQSAIRHTSSPFELPHISQNDDVKVGVIGDPAGANAELGREIFEDVVSGLVELLQSLEAESA
ncbi:MAG: creatininase family protein [Planctomycetia bacterium]|nr:creatininase family protein [Planctomycetia bacterium]